MTRALAIGALAVLLGGCRSSVAPIEIDVGGDAGTCAQFTDLKCVNYLKFSVNVDRQFTSECIKLEQNLTSLCDLPALANGQALFTFQPDQEVVLDVVGMRVFPPESCEESAQCPARRIFSGRTEKFRVGELAGKSIPLHVEVEHDCGAPESSFPFFGGMRTCDEVCGTGLVVCSFSDGCLCKKY